jgi:hypothetical protein
MFNRVRAHLTFANIASALALFIALGGSAYAISLGKNDVRSRNIAPHQVKKSDLHKNAVNRRKVANNAVASPEVKSDSLTGADLQEATLDSSIQRSIVNACEAGQAIKSLTPLGVATCENIPAGPVNLTTLQNTVDSLVSQLATLQGQVDQLCDTVLPAIESNFDALDAATAPVTGTLPVVGSVAGLLDATLPNLPANLPACP